MSLACRERLPDSFFSDQIWVTVRVSTLRVGPYVRAALLKCLPLYHPPGQQVTMSARCHQCTCCRAYALRLYVILHVMTVMCHARGLPAALVCALAQSLQYVVYKHYGTALT